MQKTNHNLLVLSKRLLQQNLTKLILEKIRLAETKIKGGESLWVCENCGQKNKDEIVACENCGIQQGVLYYGEDFEDDFLYNR